MSPAETRAFLVTIPGETDLVGKPRGPVRTTARELRDLAHEQRRDRALDEGSGFVTGAGTWAGSEVRYPRLTSAVVELRALGWTVEPIADGGFAL